MSLSSLIVSYLISILSESLTFKPCSRIFKDVHNHPKQICCHLLQLGIPSESEPAPRAALHGSHWSQTSEQQEMVELMKPWAIEVGQTNPSTSTEIMALYRFYSLGLRTRRAQV